jgi:hypothetical protein
MEKTIKTEIELTIWKEFNKAILDGNIEGAEKTIQMFMKLPDIGLIDINTFSSTSIGSICGELQVIGVPTEKIEKKLNRIEKHTKEVFVKQVNFVYGMLGEHPQMKEDEKNKFLEGIPKILEKLREEVMKKSEEIPPTGFKNKVVKVGLEKIADHINEIEELVKEAIQKYNFPNIRQ